MENDCLSEETLVAFIACLESLLLFDVFLLESI
nr:MAG TPA: hypothetical protein [Bacteriophage sp.]